MYKQKGTGGLWESEESMPLPPEEGWQHQLQVVVGIQDHPLQECSPSEATFSDFSRTCKFSYVKLRHVPFGG